MIVRYGGGNDGIVDYLINGRKAERQYTRDELDHRVVLDGDLQTTDKIINSIEDNKQDRYLHITLSFHESHVSNEMLKAVVDDYKKLLMNAYHPEEYSFYAEAHLPKIRHIQDNSTGELIERKPHIHIVIPKVNLVTGDKLDPVGLIGKGHTIEQLDAIQEHINNKYNLASPKDFPRKNSDYSVILKRVKADLDVERNSAFKNELNYRIEKEKVSDYAVFKQIVAEYGEVRIRNEGKASEYIAVKLPGDKKFTNLKSPLFRKNYIEEGKLTLQKPTPKQIEKRLNTWVNKTSHEIKHVFLNASVRKDYTSLSEAEQIEFLKERIKEYDSREKLNERNSQQTSGRAGGYKSCPKKFARIRQSEATVGLSRMPQRGMVYGINGFTRPDSISVLSDISQRDLAEQLPQREHPGQDVRRDYDRQFTESGIKSLERSSFLCETMFQTLNEAAEKNEITTMAEIRRNIDPVRFLSSAAERFNIIPAQHKIRTAKDGSPRFSVGNRNMNASDFLTKHINLAWKDAKSFLLEVYSQQLENTPYTRYPTYRRLTHHEARERLNSLNLSEKTLRNTIRFERGKLYNDLREMRRELKLIPREQRDIAVGVIVYKKLTTLERLSELDTEGRHIIRQYHADWHKDKDEMKALERLKSYLNFDEINAISADEPELSLQKAVDSQRRLEEAKKVNSKLKDLVMDKQDSRIVYRDQESEKPVFTDKGNFVVAGKNPSKEEIGIMLEYSREKFGGVLKLTGSEDFKKMCAEVAAEQDMKIILRPEQYQQMMLELKAELQGNKFEQVETQENSQESESRIEKGDVLKEQATEQAQATEQTQATEQAHNKQEIYCVNFSHLHDENEGVVFHSKDAAIDFYEGNKSSAIEKYESNYLNGDGFETIVLMSKTVSTDELSSYPEGGIVTLDKPFEVIANSYEEYRTPVYAVSFSKDEFSEDIKTFDSLHDASEYKNNMLQEHGLNQDDILITPVTREEIAFKGIKDAVNDANMAVMEQEGDSSRESPEEILASISANEHMISGLENFLVKDRSQFSSCNGDIVVEAEITRGEGGLYHLAVAGKHGLERGDAVARVDVTEQQFAAITGKTPSEVLTGDQTSARVPVITGIHFSTRAIENVNKLEQQKDYVYFSTHEGLNAEIKDFSSLKDAIEWGRVECELHDLNKRDTVIYRVESEHISQGIDAVMKNAERVERYEIEKAQGRDCTPEDGKILEAIDRFEDKFRGEGLKFEREKAESDLLNHGFTREMAEDALGKQFVQAREEHLELQQQRDNSQDMH
ncbi:TPA: relaxase/mobilization nuclease domain-containing protein [Escherichia coli]|nr:relaxase [Salmonella enterica]HAU9266915.1 relaxase/mobilization nuclease domain-containing protein [Escherichia coli]HAU9703966.1 relaxase/mobilization nuclease domain-containing protein [Escherichia coli]